MAARKMTSPTASQKVECGHPSRPFPERGWRGAIRRRPRLRFRRPDRRRVRQWIGGKPERHRPRRTIRQGRSKPRQSATCHEFTSDLSPTPNVDADQSIPRADDAIRLSTTMSTARDEEGREIRNSRAAGFQTGGRCHSGQERTDLVSWSWPPSAASTGTRGAVTRRRVRLRRRFGPKSWRPGRTDEVQTAASAPSSEGAAGGVWLRRPWTFQPPDGAFGAEPLDAGHARS